MAGSGFFCNPTSKQNTFLMTSMEGNGGRCTFGHWVFFTSVAIGRTFRVLRMGFLGYGFFTFHSFW